MRVNLTGGAYQAASLSASAQTCKNLFVEYMPAAQGEPAKATHYAAPGLLQTAALTGGAIRGLYTASTGDLFVVAGPRLYRVAADWTATFIASLLTGSGPVSMSDNTLTLVVVDGSVRGLDPYAYAGGMQVDLNTLVPQPMPTEDQGFYGADRVDFLATFFLFNRPGTSLFYTSEGLSTSFVADAFAGKMGAQDRLSAVVAVGGHVLLVGTHTSEPWALTVAPDLPAPFQSMGGAIIEHGCSNAASIAKADGAVFMLSQDRQGRGVVVKVVGGQATRVSTHAVERAIAGYADQTAWGSTYQYRGHTFYQLAFPAGTWVYDLLTEQWHQRTFQVGAAVEQPYRVSCVAAAYGRLVAGDRELGVLYEIRPDVTTDNGYPIRCTRAFPHVVNDGKRVAYTRLLVDMDVSSSIPGDLTLRYSDDRGQTFGNPVRQAIHAHGPLTSVQFRRLGMARDRVFELSWDAAASPALNGAFIEVSESAT